MINLRRLQPDGLVLSFSSLFLLFEGKKEKNVLPNYTRSYLYPSIMPDQMIIGACIDFIWKNMKHDTSGR